MPTINLIKWGAAWTSRGTVLTTELNGLGNGAYSGNGPAFDNTSNLDEWAILDIVLASLNPTTGAYLQLLMALSADGTNYEDAASTTNPGTHQAIPSVSIATGSAAKRIVVPPFRLPPNKMKFNLLNAANVALGGTLNTVTLYTTNESVVT
jgi:hypothetical protein